MPRRPSTALLNRLTAIRLAPVREEPIHYHTGRSQVNCSFFFEEGRALRQPAAQARLPCLRCGLEISWQIRLPRWHRSRFAPEIVGESAEQVAALGVVALEALLRGANGTEHADLVSGYLQFVHI